MDLQTLQSRVSELLGNDSTAMKSKITNWLNFVQHDLAHRLEFPDLLTSSTIVSIVGTQTYGLPTDLDKIKTIVWQGDVPTILSPWSVEEYAVNVPHELTVNDRGEPTNYVLLGGLNFSVYPVPNTVKNFIFRYYKHPTDMVNPTDTPSLSTHYHHELVWGGYYWGLQYEADPGRLQAAIAEYQQMFRRVRQALRKSRRENHGMVSIQDIRTNENW